MSEGLDEVLSRAKVIHLEPDDVIVMKFPGVEVDAEFVQQIKAVVGDRRVMILADDVKLGVVDWENL